MHSQELSFQIGIAPDEKMLIGMKSDKKVVELLKLLILDFEDPREADQERVTQSLIEHDFGENVTIGLKFN
ncbi:hypothetical protein FGO68_gene1131 [Halteria grandinella]|uniref:Uncharacterized protein n=1 Tax=Halteria grandinella TaxID=5974 RepID=A0A8J8SYZ5_HALGN|nr:hypothetical protein FGO68_gene1131 [Halteria grandinella]